MTATTYYVRRDDIVKGPYSLLRLQAFADERRLLSTDLYSDNIEGPWTEVSRLPGLRFLSEASSTQHARSPAAARTSPAIEHSTTSAEPQRPDIFTSFTRKAKALMVDAIQEANREINQNEFVLIGERLLIGRTPEHADWVIHDPNVSRRHALLYMHARGIVLRDLGSRTGTIVNNNPIRPNTDTLLAPLDIVRIGPATLELGDNGFHVRSRTGHAHLEATELHKTVSRPDGSSLSILTDVSLDIAPGIFAVIIGPSGSGKSTLLHALNGRSLATRGDVYLNGEHVYSHFDVLRTRMATVPQRDLLHDILTVEEALYFTADLRLPKDMSTAEKQRRVREVIEEVEMTPFARSRIRTLSGGQIKRISLANELLPKPSLIFIDEATSGLDESSDRDIMGMLRRLADAGRTILCVTHNLGHVEGFAHQVIVMANGGHLAFAGTPDETRTYFGISHLGMVYDRLNERQGNEWADDFRADARSPHRRVAQEKATRRGSRLIIERENPSMLQIAGLAIRHGSVIIRRMTELQKADPPSLAVSLAQPLCVFALIWLVFGNLRGDSTKAFLAGQSVIFLLGISAFWFGCNNSAKEIVKERDLLERERNSGLSGAGYLGAKFIYLALMSTLQSAVLYYLVAWTTGLSGASFAYLAPLLSIAVCGVALGLTISTFSPNTDVATTAVPLAVIPQVVLSGAVHQVAGLAELTAMLFSPTYWCYGATTNRLYWAVGGQDFYRSALLPMNSQSSFVVSLLVIWIFTAALLCAASIKLLGRKALELGRIGLEEWAKGQLAPKTSNRSRGKH